MTGEIIRAKKHHLNEIMAIHCRVFDTFFSRIDGQFLRQLFTIFIEKADFRIFISDERVLGYIVIQRSPICFRGLNIPCLIGYLIAHPKELPKLLMRGWKEFLISRNYKCYPEIKILAVAPEFQRQGIGRELTETIEGSCTVVTEKPEFYQSVGFRKIGQVLNFTVLQRGVIE